MSAAVCGMLVLPHQQQEEGREEVMLVNGYARGEQGCEDSQQSVLMQEKKGLSNMLAQRGMHGRLKPPDSIIPCPRCQSINTKFCYYNNYSLQQPRHFCKNCRRYWTAGGTLRNVPVGGGCRKNKRVKRSSRDSSTASPADASGVTSDGGLSNGLSPLMQGGGGSPSTTSFFDTTQYEEATKAAVARAQVARACSSGVAHSSHESSPGSDGLSVASLSIRAMDPSILTHGFFGSGGKHESGPGDLSCIFDAHAFRAAGASGASLGDHSLNGCYSHHGQNVDGYHVETEGHSHWQQQQHHKGSDMWEESHQERDGLHSSEQEQKRCGGSLRNALKGKSSLCLSPSSCLDDESSTVWGTPANPTINPYETSQDAGLNWPGSWSTPLDLMPPSGVQYGLRSEHLFDLPKSNMVNAVGFGLDDFQDESRKLS